MPADLEPQVSCSPRTARACDVPRRRWLPPLTGLPPERVSNQRRQLGVHGRVVLAVAAPVLTPWLRYGLWLQVAGGHVESPTGLEAGRAVRRLSIPGEQP